jgi:hypothetical protein
MYDITETDERKLDGYEGVPNNYHKQYHAVTFRGTKEKPAKTVMKDLIYVDVERKKESAPRTEYIYRMNMAIADAIEEGVPEAYIEKHLRPFIPK